MKRSRFTDEQIAYALRQVDGGSAVANVCRHMGISEATFYVWKKKYANLDGTEIRELRQLRDSVLATYLVTMVGPWISLPGSRA